MMSPFDQKNKAATMLDRLALRGVLLFLCVAYFFYLWRTPTLSLIAGTALFVLLALSLALLERRTLARRERMLRERLGGTIALENLVLMPNARAAESICRLFCLTLGAEPQSGAQMRYGEETWLIRCAQCLPGSQASEGDVLAAHRARLEAGADQCALVSTGSFSPAATRAAEWVDPPVRLIAGRQLGALAGRLHPATDEEIARHAKQQRTPFSFARIRALALAPSKRRRYLVCAFLLLLLYLGLNSGICLFSCLLSFLLALLCQRENHLPF